MATPRSTLTRTMLASVLALYGCSKASSDQASIGPIGGGESLASQVAALLDAKCASCHGEQGSGGVSNISDLGNLITMGYVVPGDPKRSPLFQAVKKGSMPPSGKLSDGDVNRIEKWIDTGATEKAVEENRTFVNEADVMRMCAEDLLGNFKEGERKDVRYFSLVHLYNAGTARPTIDQAAQGLSKLMNSLSRQKGIEKVDAINPDKTLFRIKLGNYGWDAARWEELVKSYPYLIVPKDDTALGALQTDTGSGVPVLRGDWFLAHGSRAPLYYALLDMPSKQADLESQLGINFLSNITGGSVMRAGFDNSGVSKNHRVIERHETSDGVLWRSYEFGGTLETQDVFSRPLGPTMPKDDDDDGGIFGDLGSSSAKDPFGGERGFTPDGGEFIFSLPNGMLAFFVVGKDMSRLSAAPTEEGEDPIIPGMSCMGCHSRGFIEKDDQVRERVGSDSQVEALYPKPATFNKQLNSDSGKYAAALADAGVDAKSKDPVFRFGSAYMLRVPLAQAAAELGVTSSELRDALGEDLSDVNDLFEDDSIDREQFKANFPKMVEALH
jgi:hypothetical protein